MVQIGGVPSPPRGRVGISPIFQHKNCDAPWVGQIFLVIARWLGRKCLRTPRDGAKLLSATPRLPRGGHGKPPIWTTHYGKKWKMSEIVQFARKRKNIFYVNYGQKRSQHSQNHGIITWSKYRVQLYDGTPRHFIKLWIITALLNDTYIFRPSLLSQRKIFPILIASLRPYADVGVASPKPAINQSINK